MKVNPDKDSLKFAAFLEEALPYVDSWTPTEINRGGCGVFAKLLSDKLKENGIPHKIYALYFEKESEKDYKNLENFLKTGENVEKAEEEHICICIEDILYVDSTGIINIMMTKVRHKVEISYETLCQLIERGGWNQTFDKGCSDIIANKLNEAFSKLNKFHSGIFVYPKKNQVEYTKHTREHLFLF